MSEIKTIASLATETEIEFGNYYKFVWIRNIGSGDCYVSAKSGITAGGADVISVKAGETALVITETNTIYSKGATTLEVHGQNFAEAPLRRSVQGGGSSITIDANPTQGSANAVSSGGVYTALQNVGGFTRTVLYDSGSPNTPAPYQEEINLLDNLSNYDMVAIMASTTIDNTTFGGYIYVGGMYDVPLLLASKAMSFQGFGARFFMATFTDTTFTITEHGAGQEQSGYTMQLYKIIGYKFGA